MSSGSSPSTRSHYEFLVFNGGGFAVLFNRRCQDIVARANCHSRLGNIEFDQGLLNMHFQFLHQLEGVARGLGIQA